MSSNLEDFSELTDITIIVANFNMLFEKLDKMNIHLLKISSDLNHVADLQAKILARIEILTEKEIQTKST